MKRLKSRAAVILLISMMCFSILLSANIFKITLVKGYVTWGIQNPTGIAVDGSGNVYVINYYNSHVEKFSSSGVYLGQVDSGQLSFPFGIAVDGSGNVYVVDYNNNRVVKFLTDSTVQTWGVYGTGNSEFRYPSGIAVDGSGNVYVADTSNNRVEKFTSNGTYVSQFGSQGTAGGEFNGPYGIAVDGSGNIYVTDKGNDRVEKFLDDGTGTFPFQCQFGSYGTGDGQFNQPLGIAVDSSGYVYVADSLNDRIQKFYSPPPGLNYVFHAKWGSYGSGDYQFWTAHEVCVDSSGAVYVADFGNNRVQKFNQYTLAINKVDPSGLNYNYVLPYEGSDTIVEGSNVSLTAVATNGYVFEGWSGDVFGTSNPITLSIFKDTNVTATFVQASALIVINTVEGVPPSEPWNYLVTDASNGTVVGNFTIPAGGGTYSLYGLGSGLYWVNETAKYYYGIPSIEYNGTVVADYGTLVNCTGSIGANVTFTHTAPALAEASLSGIVPVDWFYNIPAQQPIPIQAVAPVDINKDGRTDLVLGKPMAILVNLTGLPAFDGKVSVRFDGGPFYTNPVTAANVTSKSVIAFYPIVPNTAGNYTVTGNYTLGAYVGTLPFQTDVTVKATKDLTLYFEYMNAIAYGYVNEATFKNDVGNITAFINATYPVKNVTVYANYAGNSVTGASGAGGKTAMQTDCTAVMNKAKAALTLNSKYPANFNATTIGIAIAPNNTGMTDYFSDKGYRGAVGVSQGPGTKGVIVLDGYYGAGAHEVAHTFKLYYGIPEQYQGLPYNVTGGRPSNGVWAQQGEWRTGISFMGLIPQGVLNRTWEDNVYTYYWLFRNLTVSANDPEIIQTNGIIHIDGTVEYTSWYHMNQGTPDAVDPGGYSLVFLDANGQPIMATSFDAKFSMNIDQGVTVGQNLIDTTQFGTQSADIATFGFLAECPPDTVSVQIVDNTDPLHPARVMATVEAKDIVKIEPTYFTDSNFNPISSFDVLFTPSSGTLKLTATDPATYYYTLDFKNNGPAQSSLVITVQIPTDFNLEGTQPVQINFNPVSYTFANGVLKVIVPNVASGQTFTLRAHLNYNLKGTKPYPPDPTTYFRQYTFETVANDVYSATATINAVGKKATAIGGFVTDTAGRPKGGLQVKVYKGLCEKWNTIVDGDGFYFVNVDVGGPYTIILFNSNNVPVWVKTCVNVANGAFVSVDFKVPPIDCAIQGFIKDTQNIPVAGVTVQLLNQAGKVITTTTTNLGGYYVFRFYLPGTYTVKIMVPPGYSATPDSKTIRVRLTETATVNFDLTKN